MGLSAPESRYFRRLADIARAGSFELKEILGSDSRI